MKNLANLFSLCIVAICLIGCVKSFEVDSFDFERVVVVDGVITDELKRHAINLSYTFPINSEEETPITSASVWVENDSGSRMDFSEVAPGQYQSNAPFAASEGTGYQLFFTTEQGNQYLSREELLIKSPPIDSIYDRYAEIVPEGAISNEGGIQFFLDTHDASSQASYFRYEWEEVYKIAVPFPSLYDYDAAADSVFLRTEPVHICYAGSRSTSLIIGNTVGLEGNRLAEFPIRFVSGETPALRTRYTILVRQYALNAEAYGFYRKLKESNESGGSLFDTQQGTIFGNVSSISNPEETVLGYFEVSGVSSLRTFWSSGDLDPLLPQPEFRYNCSNTVETTTIDSLWFYARRNNRLIDIDYSSPTPVVFGPSICTDCSWYANPLKPVFWID